jgi:hypothetical protein
MSTNCRFGVRNLVGSSQYAYYSYVTFFCFRSSKEDFTFSFSCTICQISVLMSPFRGLMISTRSLAAIRISRGSRSFYWYSSSSSSSPPHLENSSDVMKQGDWIEIHLSPLPSSAPHPLTSALPLSEGNDDTVIILITTSSSGHSVSVILMEVTVFGQHIATRRGLNEHNGRISTPKRELTINKPASAIVIE